MTFTEDVINNTVDKLMKGEDYRDEIVNSINAVFFDFTIDFFKEIVDAKMNNKEINFEWYRDHFIHSDRFKPDESAIFAGINKKTITNMYGTATKNVVLEVANNNFDYLSEMVSELKQDATDGLDVIMKINYKDTIIDLSLPESLLVINALATKKLQIRGGAWSSIGKKVEKPLVDRLCACAGVPAEYIDNSHFKKDKSKAYDREIDYYLISEDKQKYKVEVKLMGKGNPESADATIARDSDIFIADTLSEQNCNQLADRGIEYLILKGHTDSVEKFIKILDKLNIPHNK